MEGYEWMDGRIWEYRNMGGLVGRRNQGGVMLKITHFSSSNSPPCSFFLLPPFTLYLSCLYFILACFYFSDWRGETKIGQGVSTGGFNLSRSVVGGNKVLFSFFFVGHGTFMVTLYDTAWHGIYWLIYSGIFPSFCFVWLFVCVCFMFCSPWRFLFLGYVYSGGFFRGCFVCCYDAMFLFDVSVLADITRLSISTLCFV